ncbi:hypothetical protein SSX86_007728 [Deinandra increscens subsp. villosa]|uniref:Uncharacterized protein n=1 Tax=Deinandra increscens subsp. villosa TaxID=3103831 RepID=A0AAP0DLP9_9ASTR
MGGTKNTILNNDHNTPDNKSNPKLTLLPLIALIFYEFSGGPFGVEDSVRAGDFKVFDSVLVVSDSVLVSPVQKGSSRFG